MAEVTKTVDPKIAAKDTNGDGHISLEEYEMDMEFKRKELEDADAMRDAQRKMAWFALGGMLLYPFAVVLAMGLGLGNAVSAIEGFGILSLASICPIIAVLTMGIIIQIKNKFSQNEDYANSIDPNLVAGKEL